MEITSIEQLRAEIEAEESECGEQLDTAMAEDCTQEELDAISARFDDIIKRLKVSYADHMLAL